MNKTIDNHKTGQRILSLLLITISISTILLSASWMKAHAISANDITVTAPQSGYYYPGLTLSCMITVTGATNNTTASLYYPYYTYGSNPQKLITGLSHIDNTIIQEPLNCRVLTGFLAENYLINLGRSDSSASM